MVPHQLLDAQKEPTMKLDPSNVMRRLFCGAVVASLLGVTFVACDSSSSSGDGDGDGDGDGSMGGNPQGGDGPVYATFIRVQNPESRSHYLNLYRELPDDGQIDRSKGVEFGGRAQATIYNDSIYVFDLDNSAVTRWTVDEDLEPEEQESVSFATTGLTVACQICNAFVSPERAFIQNAWSGTLVAWDPTNMELLETTSIPEEALTRDGLDGEFIWPLVVNERVFLGAGWADYENAKFSTAAAVAVFDGSVDSPNLEIIEDDRCGTNSGMQPFADEDGNVYAGGNWYSGWHQAGTPELAPNPACLLRIKPGEDEFDPDYYVDLLEATDSRAVRFARGMEDGKMLLSVWRNSEPALTQEEREEDPQAYWSTLVWSYVILDVDTLEMTSVDIPTAGAGNQTPLSLEGKTLVQAYEDGPTDNESGATLYRVGLDGSVEELLSAGPGGDFAMVSRLR